MNVIVVNDFGSKGGGATEVAVSSVRTLAGLGIDVTFFFGEGPVDSSINLDEVRVVDLGAKEFLTDPARLRAAFNGIWRRETARRFGGLLQHYRPTDTVIHFHSWVKVLSSSLIREAQLRGFKYCITLHDYFSVCPNGGFFCYPKGAHCRLRAMSFKCVFNNCDSRGYAYKLWRVARHFVQARYAYVPRKVSFFISVSDYSEKILKNYFPARTRVFRVRNPVVVERRPASNPSRYDSFTFVGRLSSEKGGTLFAQAAKRANVQAIFVGAGSDEPKIRDINPQATVVGWCDRERVIEFMMASRAVVFPSLWHETQGLTVWEAAACGVPVIVSKDCAASEAIEDGVTGLRFKSGNMDDLTQKLAVLRDDPQLAVDLGRAAYEKYWRSGSSSEEAHGEALIEVYRSILGS